MAQNLRPLKVSGVTAIAVADALECACAEGHKEVALRLFRIAAILKDARVDKLALGALH